MGEIKQSPKEDRIKEAWRNWLEVDYSWEGLKTDDFEHWYKTAKEFSSLQEYWRTDPKTGQPRTDEELVKSGELIVSPEQKTYHIAHLPIFYADGTPTEKYKRKLEIIEKLRSIIIERLDNSAPTINLDIKEANFEGKFPAYLQGVVFLELDLSFESYKLPINALFMYSIFSEEVSFSGARLYTKVQHNNADSSIASYSDATFLKYANFYETKFSNGALFISVFAGTADFRHSEFSEDTLFRQCQFYGKSLFSGTEFRHGFMCDKTVFHDEAWFSETKFHKNLVLSGSTFKKMVFFEGISWPKNAIHYCKAFQFTTFENLAYFSTSGLMAFSAFDGAKFENGIKLDKVSERQASKTFKNEVASLRDLNLVSKSEWQSVVSDRKSFSEKRAKYTKMSEVALEALEGGCRVLKREMEKLSDKNREQLFYKFELFARRYQKSTGWGEKLVSWLYGHYSDYGTSYVRPFYGLLSLWLMFSLLFWPMSQGTFAVSWPKAVQFVDQSVWFSKDTKGSYAAYRESNTQDHLWPSINGDRFVNVLTVSASRVFPFGAFEEVSKTFAQRADLQSPWLGFLFRILGTAQSFMALSLAFMFGLAIRRRFQIN